MIVITASYSNESNLIFDFTGIIAYMTETLFPWLGWLNLHVLQICIAQCAFSIQMMICKLCCKKHKYCWQDDDIGWYSWLASDCYNDLSDGLYNLPSTTVWDHTHHTFPRLYPILIKCLHSVQIKVSSSQCIQIILQAIFKPPLRLVLQTLSCLQFPIEESVGNYVIPSLFSQRSLPIVYGWKLLLFQCCCIQFFGGQ